jgi:aminoglycoside phosphotransferase (APT) family kinase protein
MPLPSKRDPQQIADILGHWYEQRLGTRVHIADVGVPSGTGMSSETILFNLDPDGMKYPKVARIRPSMDDWPVFPVYDLEAQYKAMQFVAARSDVPVPTVTDVELDESILGAPFFIMDRINGEAPPDMMPYTFGGSFLDAMSAEERRDLQRNAATVLAKIHAIPLEDEDVSFAAPNLREPLRRMLDEQREYYEWSRAGISYPTIEAAFDYLERNMPSDPGPVVLSWGDARIGNMLFQGPRPVAVLDWEMVNVGHPGVDVGWMVFMHRFFQNIAEVMGMPGFPDMMLEEDVIADYVAAGGHDPGDLTWYQVYAAMRFAAISIRTSRRQIAYGEAAEPDDPEQLIMHRDLLRSMIGLS